MRALVDVTPPPAAPRPFSRSDRLALEMFSSKLRWVTTVGLQGFLGLFFLLTPGLTVSVLDVTDTVETRTLFALYGGLLLHRAAMEQFVRNGRDPAWIRAYMWSTFPFGISSSIVLGWASLEGLVNPIFGWMSAVLFVAELAEFSVVLLGHRREKLVGA
jgi:hypothetical protein